jgi:hypothetical protein
MKYFTLFINLSLIVTGFIFASGFNFKTTIVKQVTQRDTLALKVTLPKNGKMVNNKPIGKNWQNLLESLQDWNADPAYWTLQNGALQGDYMGGKLHNYAWTKKTYKNFELNAIVKLDGQDPNSGICVRIHPTDADNAPGYQVDMGEGYWGSLWEERRKGMVQAYPPNVAAKLVKNKNWNHYYVMVKGHHVEAWLNGVKTIDVVHNEGFDDGAIGLQLCHGDKHTIVVVAALYVRELK